MLFTLATARGAQLLGTAEVASGEAEYIAGVTDGMEKAITYVMERTPDAPEDAMYAVDGCYMWLDTCQVASERGIPMLDESAYEAGEIVLNKDFAALAEENCAQVSEKGTTMSGGKGNILEDVWAQVNVNGTIPAGWINENGPFIQWLCNNVMRAGSTYQDSDAKMDHVEGEGISLPSDFNISNVDIDFDINDIHSATKEIL